MKLKALDDRKVQILDKLADAGADTEKKLSELGMAEAFAIIEKTNVQIQDLHLISEIQAAAKRRRLYAYLADGTDEKDDKDGAAIENASVDTNDNSLQSESAITGIEQV